MKRLLLTILLTVSSVAGGTGGATAQITGVVIDDSGRPLPNVRIEGWGRQLLIVTTTTNEEGRFLIVREEAEGVREIRASILGFENVQVPVVADTRRYIIQMGLPVVSIEGVMVSSERDQCSINDQREARSLWQALQDRYQPAQALDTLGVASYVASSVGVGGGDPLAPLELPEIADSRHGSASLLRFSWRRRAEKDGYAYRIRRTDLSGAYESWSYAPLQDDFAPHFLDGTFGELHKLTFVQVAQEDAQESEEDWILSFCPKDGGDPTIQGQLRVSRDTTLISAEWIFRTPEPVEDAGGKAFFAEARVASGEPYLLPLESIAWRRLPTGNFYKKHQRFEEWILAPGDSVPFLPVRGR